MVWLQVPNMTPGLRVHADVAAQFDAFKLHRAPHDFRYFVYRIVGSSEIVIDSTGPRTDTFEDLAAKLLPVTDDCRFAVIDLKLTSKDGRPTSKVVFLSWSPETAPVKRKMLCAASRESIKRALTGVGIYLTATDAAELSREAIDESLARYL